MHALVYVTCDGKLAHTHTQTTIYFDLSYLFWIFLTGRPKKRDRIRCRLNAVLQTRTIFSHLYQEWIVYSFFIFTFPSTPFWRMGFSVFFVWIHTFCLSLSVIIKISHARCPSSNLIHFMKWNTTTLVTLWAVISIMASELIIHVNFKLKQNTKIGIDLGTQ